MFCKSLCVLFCKKVRLCVYSSEYLLEFFVITPTKKKKKKPPLILKFWSLKREWGWRKSIRKQWLTPLCLCWRPRQDVCRFVLINSTRKWPDWLVWEVLAYIRNDFVEAGTLSQAAGHCCISTTCQCQFTAESPTPLPALAALCNACDSDMQSQRSLWTGSLQRKWEVSIALDRPNDNLSVLEKPKICALVNQTWTEM